MKNTKKIIVNLFLFTILLGVVFFYLFKKIDINELLKTISNSNIIYLSLAFLMMGIHIFCEANIIHMLIKRFKYKKSIFKCIKYSSSGFFFSGITPSASGGQPMQIYYMFQDGIPVSCSSLTLLIVLTGYIIINTIFALIGLFYNNQLIMEIGNIRFFIYFGIIINLLAMIVCLILVFTKKLSTKIIKLFIKILKLFKYKKAEEKEKSLNEGLVNYHNCSKYLKENKLIFLKILLITVIQLVSFYSVTYLVYKSFGLNEYSYFTIILLQAVLYTTTSILPLPGSIGANESGFYILFKKLFSTNLIASGMLLTRAANFYIYMLITGLILLIYKIYETINNKLKNK